MTKINIDYQIMDNNGKKNFTPKFCNVCGFFQSIGRTILMKLVQTIK